LKSSEIEASEVNEVTKDKVQQVNQRRGNTSGNHKAANNLEIFTPAETLAMQPPATTHLQRMMQVRSTTNKSKNESQLGQQTSATPLSPSG
jgi:hypothetical protein